MKWIKSWNKKQKIIFIIGVAIALAVAFFLLLFSNNERSLERRLARMITTYYKEDYFEALKDHPEFLEVFAKGGGIQISLSTLETNGFNIGDFRNRRTGEDCDKETTHGVIKFNSDDYRNDFYVEVHLDCGF